VSSENGQSVRRLWAVFPNTSASSSGGVFPLPWDLLKTVPVQQPSARYNSEEELEKITGDSGNAMMWKLVSQIRTVGIILDSNATLQEFDLAVNAMTFMMSMTKITLLFNQNFNPEHVEAWIPANPVRVYAVDVYPENISQVKVVGKFLATCAGVRKLIVNGPYASRLLSSLANDHLLPSVEFLEYWNPQADSKFLEMLGDLIGHRNWSLKSLHILTTEVGSLRTLQHLVTVLSDILEDLDVELEGEQDYEYYDVRMWATNTVMSIAMRSYDMTTNNTFLS